MTQHEYRIVKTSNPECRLNHFFVCLEDLHSPRFARFRKRYQLDRIVHGEKDEFRRILLLRDWLHGHMAVCPPGHKPFSAGEKAENILDAALKGGAFLCGHFTIVYNAMLNAMGYPARFLHAGNGDRKKDLCAVHAVTEVWCNRYCKWILSDAKHHLHYEKEGVPLSALEIRDAVLKDEGRSITRVAGPDSRPFEPPKNQPWWIEFQPAIYQWLSWEWQGNRLSSHPQYFSSALAVCEDDFFRRHTWFRASKKHWAYATNHFIRTQHREWIEWTPNVLEVKTRLEGNLLLAEIRSCTPGFKEYQIRDMHGRGWRPCDFRLKTRLTRKRHEWLLRAKNVAGVCGPEYRLVVEQSRG